MTSNSNFKVNSPEKDWDFKLMWFEKFDCHSQSINVKEFIVKQLTGQKTEKSRYTSTGMKALPNIPNI